MTIASEITRLQGAKSDIRQAIIDKGVDVGSSITLDQYAECINDISSGVNVYYANILIVGGGAGGRTAYNGGGGGGGEVKCQCNFGLLCSQYQVFIGCGGSANNDGGISCILGGGQNILQAYGGQGYGMANYGGRSGSGCCGGGPNSDSAGGGGGAGSNGGDASRYNGGGGGNGLYGYGGGGGGAGSQGRAGGGSGGGGYGGAHNYTDKSGGSATEYGGGGGGSETSPGCGCQGMVEFCYPTDGSYGFTTATGGQCCYTCNGYNVHRFTSSGTFTIVS